MSFLEESSEGERVMDVRFGLGAIAGGGDARGEVPFRRMECEEPIESMKWKWRCHLRSQVLYLVIYPFVVPGGR